MQSMSREFLDLLVIDDEPEILRLIEDTLRDQHIHVRLAASVAVARTELQKHPFRVILTDQRLPDGNGLDLLAEAATIGHEPIPMLMTGLVDVNLAIEAINRGGIYKLLTKPLIPLQLIQTVRLALDQHRRNCERSRLASEVLHYSEQLRKQSAQHEQGIAAAHDRLRSSARTMETQQQVITRLYSELQQSYLSTVMSLSEVIDARDRYTRGHCDRVYHYCELIANELGLDEPLRNDLRIASALHDLGKIGVPDAILRKGGPLESHELSVMKSHPTLTEKILEPLPFLESVRRIVREHHERFNGTGYPAGLNGTEICIGARILSVADAFDAMCSDRPYRAALEPEIALRELQSEAGRQFCPMCVGALLVAFSKSPSEALHPSCRIPHKSRPARAKLTKSGS